VATLISTMRRSSILLTATFGALVVAFSAWCCSVLIDVSRLREGVERRVGWLGELQELQSAIAGADAATLPEIEADLHALDLDLLEHRASSDALSHEVAVAIVETRALRSRPEDASRRASIGAGLSRSITELRRENGALSAELGSRWTALRFIAMSAIAMSTGLLALLAHSLLVVSPRLRQNALRLEQLSRNLEESSRAARGMGHEFGGPLTSALTTLQLLRDDMRGTVASHEDHVRLLEEAISALSRAAGTLQDLRASSDSSEEPTADVHAALDDALAATRFREGTASRVTIDAEQVGLAALPQPVVRRLFTQILGGSAARRGATTSVAVRTRQEQALISVEFGVSGADADTYAGVSRALAVLGGSLSVRREADADVVRVELPQHRRPVAPRRTTIVEPQPIRILLVDDDPSVLSSVSRVLLPNQVTTTSDPDQAIELAIGGDFQLVLCDMMMPRKTGIEVFDAVTAARPELAARFVFMSGGSIEPEAAAALERAPARIDKPFGAAELRRLVARYGDGAAGHGHGQGHGHGGA
jgi:CheY-like chemotaxis protein